MAADSPHLDGAYAAFGKVVEGLEHVDSIVSLKRDMRDYPVAGNRHIMQMVTVDLKGQTYPKPETV